MTETLSLESYIEAVEQADTLSWVGEVTSIVGLLIESAGPAVSIGDFCEVAASNGRMVRTQVIGFRNGRVLAMPLEEPEGLHLGARVIARSEDARLAVGPGLLGRVLDGFGLPIDGGPPIEGVDSYPLYSPPPNPLNAWSRDSARSTDCSRAEKDNVSGCSADRASAKARCWERCRERTPQTSA
jgi:flagellar biosynthesis/type III secretory pathway ATPase